MVKFSIYLNRRVFVMTMTRQLCTVYTYIHITHLLAVRLHNKDIFNLKKISLVELEISLIQDIFNFDLSIYASGTTLSQISYALHIAIYIFTYLLAVRLNNKDIYNYCPFDISRKDVFCLAFYFE